MSKFVVVVFPDETKAYAGLQALKELDAEDSLTVYAGALIVKDADGTVSVKENMADALPARRSAPCSAA
jgi:uncharacterized membrane protein